MSKKLGGGRGEEGKRGEERGETGKERDTEEGRKEVFDEKSRGSGVIYIRVVRVRGVYIVIQGTSKAA